MRVEFNRTGADRKALVTAIGEILETKPKYMGMPTAAYDLGGLIVDKTGTLEFDENVFPKDIKDLLQKLADRGFFQIPDEDEPETEEKSPAENSHFTIKIDDSELDGNALSRFEALIESKENLIKKALGAESLTYSEENGKFAFNWFKANPSDTEMKAYQHFISALVKEAKERKRITAKPKEVDNEKYAFRCFLLRLGFIGEEYKTDRKILLKNLTGSSAYKNGAKKEAEQDEISE